MDKLGTMNSMAMSRHGPLRRAYAPTVKTERVEYVRERDGRAFVIEADKHGSWRVMAGDQVLIDRPVQQDYYGRPKWGSKALLDKAISEARAAIEGLE